MFLNSKIRIVDEFDKYFLRKISYFTVKISLSIFMVNELAPEAAK